MVNSAIYFGAIVAGQLASFLLLPIITRFLDPFLFGQYALVLSVTGFVGTFGSSWVRNVGMRLYFDHVTSQSTRRFFWTAALLQFVLMAPALFIGYAVILFTGDEIPAALYMWGGASVVVADFYSLALNTTRAEQKAIVFGVAEVMSAAVRLGGTWAALLMGYRSPATLIAFSLVATAIATLPLAPTLRRVLTGPAGVDKAIAAQLVRFGVPAIPLSVGMWVIALSDRTLLAYFRDLDSVGVYAATSAIADRAVGGVVAALFMAAWPAILNDWSQGGRRVEQTIAGYMRVYALLLVGPSALLALESEFVLRLLTSEAYAVAAPIIPWVVAGAWLFGFATYLNRPLELNKRYGALSGITIAAAAVNLVLNVIFIPRWGAFGAAVSTTAAFGAMAVASRYFANRELYVRLPWKSMGLSAASALIAALCWWVSRKSSTTVVSISLYFIIYYSIILAALRRSGGLRSVLRV